MIINILQLKTTGVRLPPPPPVFNLKTAHFSCCVSRAFVALCCSKVVARDFLWVFPKWKKAVIKFYLTTALDFLHGMLYTVYRAVHWSVKPMIPPFSHWPPSSPRRRFFYCNYRGLLGCSEKFDTSNFFRSLNSSFLPLFQFDTGRK